MTSMSTPNHDSAHHEHHEITIDADQPISAKLTPPQWFGVIAILFAGVAAVYTKMWTVESAINEATKVAQTASADARTALTQAAELKGDLNRALGEISGKLGYIQGQLERITAGAK